MADVKDMDLDPGYTFLMALMWRQGLTELEFPQSEMDALVDAMEGQSLLIVPTDRGCKIMLGTRQMAEQMAEGLDVATGKVDAGVTIN